MIDKVFHKTGETISNTAQINVVVSTAHHFIYLADKEINNNCNAPTHSKSTGISQYFFVFFFLF